MQRQLIKLLFVVLGLSVTLGWQSSTLGCFAGPSCPAGTSSIGALLQFGPPLYLGSTTSTANPGPISPIFIAGINGTNAASCTGMCQNSTAYDTTLNRLGVDCITRITDGTTFPSGQSMGNLTFSGGDNDIMGSVNETYLGVNTGVVYILKMDTSGNCIQVMNTGHPALFVAGPFGFSKVLDTRFYYLVNKTQLWQEDIGDVNKALGVSPNVSTKLVDIFATGICPGVNPSTFGTPSTGSIMGIKSDDSRFGWSVGPGTQGSADWSFVWDRTLGCAAVNFATGQYWNFCSVSCGPSTPATGTLFNGPGSCFGSEGSIGHGIHDSQMSGDGTVLQVAMSIAGSPNVPWTQGSCATGNPGSTLANQQTLWTIGTATTQWAYSNSDLGVGGWGSGSHNSFGQTNYVTPYFGGPNIRPITNVRSISQFLAPFPATVADSHFSWPNPLFDDSYPWVGASDLVPVAQGGPIAPHNLGNVVFAVFPNGTYPPGTAPKIFAHTFSCNTTATTNCPSGVGDAGFGAQQSIGYGTQKGNWFCWTSTHLQSLGKDNLGNPRSDGFCVHLQ